MNFDTDNVKFWNATSDIHANIHSEDFPPVDDADSTIITGTFNKTADGIFGVGWESPPTGTSNRVKIGGTPSDYDFFLTQNSTINMWIKDVSCDDNTEGILGTGMTVGGDGISIFAGQCNSPTFETLSTNYQVDGVGQHQGEATDGTYKAQDGQFHMYTILHDSSDGTPQGMFDFYVDGVFVNRNCLFGCTEDLTTGNTVQTPIFFNNPNFGLGMNNATFDEFSFWSKLLNATEISTLYNDGFGLMLNNFEAQQNPPQVLQTE